MIPGNLLARSGRRHWLRHPWQALLAVGGIAMGVAMVVAIDLASQSARASYLWSTESLAGRATHQIQGVEGSLPDSLYVRLRLQGLRDARGNPVPLAPVVEARIAATAHAQDSLPFPIRLVGIDPFATRDFAAFGLADTHFGEAGKENAGPGVAESGAAGAGGGLSLLMVKPGAALVAKTLADRMKLVFGDTLIVPSEGNRPGPYRLVVIGYLEPRNRAASVAIGDLVLCDIATAQEALGAPGRLSRIDVDLHGADSSGRSEQETSKLSAQISDLLKKWDAKAQWVPAGARARTLDNMTKAFRINLTALSLLALLVGAFLIYNTMSFSVAQRWRWFGTLRGLGASSGEMAWLIGGEALVLGCLGTLTGLPLGVALGRGLVVLVARTINDLYFSAHVSGLGIEPAVLIKGVVLGVGMTMLASLWPAFRVAGIHPRALLTRSSQETRMLTRMPWLWGLGAAMGLVSLALWRLPGGNLFAGFASLVAATFAWTFWTPGLLLYLMKAAGVLLGGLTARLGSAGLLARMAAREVGASLSRTGVAAVALVTALSVTVAMGIMVDSFRHAVRDWLGTVLVADIYASPRIQEGGRMGGRIDSELVTKIASLPGVAGVTTYLSTTLLEPEGQIHLLAMRMDKRSRKAFRFLGQPMDSAWTLFQRMPECGVLVSEPFAYRRGLRAGMDLQLPTRQGPAAFPVIAVFADYGSDQGMVILNRECFERYWEERKISSLALFADSDRDVDSLIGHIHSLAGSGSLEVRSNRALREASLEIFDRTFAITSVLRLVAVLVALAGLLGALAALELERTRETALLRALGLTPMQVWGLATGQSTLLGLATGLLAIPLGLAQAALLIEVINRRSFGWSMDMRINAWLCLQTVVMGLAAGLLAGALPAWRMALPQTARAMREE